MAQVVLDYKIISRSKIHVWLFKLGPKTDFHDRNSEGMRRKFSTKVQTLPNNLLLLNFLPSPGISGMEGTPDCCGCRSGSGEDTVAGGAAPSLGLGQCSSGWSVAGALWLCLC